MSTEMPLVSYRRLNEALSTPESVAVASEEAQAVDPNEAAAMVVAINSALAAIEAASKDQDNTLKGDNVLVSPDHRIASLLQTYVANEAMKEGKVAPVGADAFGGEQFEAKFDEKDWFNWAKSFFSWWKGIVDHPWQETPQTTAIPNTAKVAMLGDWGTGRYGAPVCSQSIHNDVEGYPVRLHLGDVYYSGDTNEVKDQFLKFWPKAKSGNEVDRACNSNHEMYTGGRAYFKQILAQFKQTASYFALQNDNWILAGLDTAYKEKDLKGNQVEWLTNLINNAGGRRIILLSHHQLFSPFEGGHPKINQKLDALLTGGKIFAWYWGHEHRCIIYDQHPGWKLYARCVGHSGYPYFRDKLDNAPTISSEHQNSSWRQLPAKNLAPSSRILDGPNPYIVPDDPNRYGPNGYMTLKLDSDHLTEVVHAPDGTVLYSKQLV